MQQLRIRNISISTAFIRVTVIYLVTIYTNKIIILLIIAKFKRTQ